MPVSRMFSLANSRKCDFRTLSCWNILWLFRAPNILLSLFFWSSMASVILRWKTQPRAISSCYRKLRHSSRSRKIRPISSATMTRCSGYGCGTLSSNSYRSSEWNTKAISTSLRPCCRPSLWLPSTQRRKAMQPGRSLWWWSLAWATFSGVTARISRSGFLALFQARAFPLTFSLVFFPVLPLSGSQAGEATSRGEGWELQQLSRRLIVDGEVKRWGLVTVFHGFTGLGQGN